MAQTGTYTGHLRDDSREPRRVRLHCTLSPTGAKMYEDCCSERFTGNYVLMSAAPEQDHTI